MAHLEGLAINIHFFWNHLANSVTFEKFSNKYSLILNKGPFWAFSSDSGIPPMAGLNFCASGTAGSASELALNFRRSPASSVA